MTKEEAVEMLIKLQSNDDMEMAHIHADSILCDLLTALGCKEVVEEYEKINKWYAQEIDEWNDSRVDGKNTVVAVLNKAASLALSPADTTEDGKP